VSGLFGRAYGESRSPKRRRPITGIALTACGAVVMLATFLVPASAASASGLAPTFRAAATASTGTVTGTVTVTGAPKGFQSLLTAVGGCRSGSFALCATPQLGLASGGPYTLTLTAGNWNLQGFYLLGLGGGSMLGAPKTVTVEAGETETVDFTVAYQKTGSVKGTVSVTKVPTGTGIWGKTAEACPSYAPNPDEVSADLVCAAGDGSGNYSFTTLSPGTWILYPTYETEFGQSFGKASSVMVVSGSTRTVNLTTPFLPPPGGIVSGSVKVASFPGKSSDPVGVLACKGSTVSYSCAGLQENPVTANGASYGMPLNTGTWTLAAFYEPEPYGGLQYGPPKTVHVVAGMTLNLPLAMVFIQPGAVSGKVTVSGQPDGVNILNYSVLACPAGSPFDGNPLDPECAGETSGVITSPLLGELGANTKITGGRSVRAASSSTSGTYSMPLPPGSWLLYPGYSSGFGPIVSTNGTPVSITTDRTSTGNVTMAYKPPTNGLISGTTNLIDAPTAIGELGLGGVAGVEACPSPGSTSPNETCSNFTMNISPNGDYQLAVPTGTWWISELYWYLPGLGGGASTSDPIAGGPAQKVVVTAGTSYVVNLTAKYGVG
jgi:hypothetical protein